MTVLFVTHDLAVARLMGDRIAVMQSGRVVELGTAEQVVVRPPRPLHPHPAGRGAGDRVDGPRLTAAVAAQARRDRGSASRPAGGVGRRSACWSW